MNKLAVALSLPIGAALLLQANPSQASTTVTVNGTAYEINFYNGPLPGLLGEHGAPPSPKFPWFGDTSLAMDFANALYAEQGTLTQFQYLEDAMSVSGQIELGPLFYSSPNGFVAYNPGSASSNIYSCDADNAINCEGPVIDWAYVQVPSTPTPAPLPLLGATAAFSYSRKLRRRLSAQKFTF
jgi:hypothetical protein